MKHKRKISKRIHLGALAVLILLLTGSNEVMSQTPNVLKVQIRNRFPDPSLVTVNGELGRAISICEKGRLTRLPSWNDSALIKMFTEEARNKNTKQDWYGEHAGKWLYATSLAVERTHNDELKKLLLHTADFLVSNQEANGYMGSYSPALRLTNKNNQIKNRSWDVWSLSYMTLGLLKLHEYFPREQYINAAKKIGELFLRTFGDGNAVVTDYGTRDGISATIILDPVVELYEVTGDQRYLNFAKLVVKEMEDKQGVRFVSVGLHHGDMESIGEGKAYQIIWNLTSLVKMYEVTGDEDILAAVENSWKNIVDYHLTIAGGPWGGIGKHYECFNRKGFWDPYGFIETCSIMSWIQFNKELLKVTGEAKYAQEIEKSAYNALQGAQYPNGIDWSYHSFSNGRKHVAHFNDCCPSSGAMALEELPSVVYSIKERGIVCNLYTQSNATLLLPGVGRVKISQETAYPFKGNIKLTVDPESVSRFPVFLRIPDWVVSAIITINGKKVPEDNLRSGSYFKLEKDWKKDDIINIVFPFELHMHQKSENATVPQGKDDIYNVSWFALSRGPLIYSINGLIGGNEREGVYEVSSADAAEIFKQTATPKGFEGAAYQLTMAGKTPLIFVPYYEAGGRSSGTWRLTWVQKYIEN